MYRQVDDFLKDWAVAAKSTLQVLQAVTDDKLGQEASCKGIYFRLVRLAFNRNNRLYQPFGRFNLPIDWSR